MHQIIYRCIIKKKLSSFYHSRQYSNECCHSTQRGVSWSIDFAYVSYANWHTFVLRSNIFTVTQRKALSTISSLPTNFSRNFPKNTSHHWCSRAARCSSSPIAPYALLSITSRLVTYLKHKHMRDLRYIVSMLNTYGSVQNRLR